MTNPITITAKVNKGIHDFSGIMSRDLKPYEGKTITFQIVEVKETVVTEKKDQGVVITETKKVIPDKTKPDKMTRTILDAYASFRTEAFTATVTEMGIKEFGEDCIPKAYIDFDDGGAPLTYPIEAKGKLLVEAAENGRSRIKNFGTGAFVEQAKKLGYQTYIDVDPDTYEFGCIPSIVGQSTTWDIKKGGDRIDSEGIKKEGYTNFILVGIGPVKKPVPAAQPQTPVKPPQTPPEQKVEGLDPKLLQAWKDTLQIILVDSLDQAGIQKAINELNKALPAGDSMKAVYAAMAKVRVPALKALKDQKFIQLDSDMKFELVV